jgi:hypothetical protein
MKERMHAKSEMNKAAKEAQGQQQTANKPVMSEEELIALFSKGEKAEKTPRNANPNNQSSIPVPLQNTVTSSSGKSGKSKNNKKKGKK